MPQPLDGKACVNCKLWVGADVLTILHSQFTDNIAVGGITVTCARYRIVFEIVIDILISIFVAFRRGVDNYRGIGNARIDDIGMATPRQN